MPETELAAPPNPRGGPRTAAGKRRSSINALRHGLTATSPQALEAIAQACKASFTEILEEISNHYRPADPIEARLVERIARCAWRLDIASEMESRMLDRNPVRGRPGTSHEKIMKFERLVDIHLHRAIAALTKKREAENRNNSRDEPFPRSAREGFV